MSIPPPLPGQPVPPVTPAVSAKPPRSLGWFGLSMGLLFVSFGVHTFCDPVGEVLQRLTGEVVSRFVPPAFAPHLKSMVHVLVTNPSPLLLFAGVLVVTVFWPLINAFMGASLGHLGVLLTGGSAHGWRGTSRSVWLHRFWVEALSLGLILMACWLPLALEYRVSLLFFGLPFIRLATMLALFTHLVRTQSIGVFRSVCLLAPVLAIVCTLSILVSLLSAAWLSLWCLGHYL